MEVRRIRRVPSAQQLSRIRIRCDHRPEKVHPPLRPLRLPIIDIEEAQRDADIRHPRLPRSIEFRSGVQTINKRLRDVESIERRAGRTHFRRVVDEGLEGDVVGVDLELEVGLRVVGAFVDEGFHDLVGVDGVIGGLGGVEEEVCLVVGGEVDADGFVVVAQVNLGEGKGGLVRNGFVVLDGALGWTCRDVEAWYVDSYCWEHCCSGRESKGAQGHLHGCWDGGGGELSWT